VLRQTEGRPLWPSLRTSPY